MNSTSGLCKFCMSIISLYNITLKYWKNHFQIYKLLIMHIKVIKVDYLIRRGLAYMYSTILSLCLTLASLYYQQFNMRDVQYVKFPCMCKKKLNTTFFKVILSDICMIVLYICAQQLSLCAFSIQTTMFFVYIQVLSRYMRLDEIFFFPVLTAFYFLVCTLLCWA